MHDGGAWHGTVHLLCTYHLAKNFFKHVHPVISDVKVWRELNSWFWKLAKYSDARFDADTEWAAFQVCVFQHASGPTVGNVKLWLENLYMRKAQWMAVYTWAYATLGVHSTQRAEAIHSAIKCRRMKNLSAQSLTESLITYNLDSRAMKQVCAIRLSIRQHCSSFLQHSSLVAPLATKITPYAFDLLQAQYNMAMNYRSEETECGKFKVVVNDIISSAARENTFRPVVSENGLITSWRCHDDFGLSDSYECAGHLTDLTTCTCQYPNVFKLPCRHIFHLHIVQQRDSLTFECGQCWKVHAPQEVSENIRALRTMASNVPTRGPSAVPAPTFQDRRSILLDAFLPLLDAAARNVDSYHTFLHCMPAMQYALQTNTVLSIASNTACNEAVPAIEAEELTEDQRYLRQLLGSTYSTATKWMWPQL
jgi:hypothetical protein